MRTPLHQRNWTAIYLASAPIAICATILTPQDWPEFIRWAPALIVWYIAGRRDQWDETRKATQ